jgi:hypothetical protein
MEHGVYPSAVSLALEDGAMINRDDWGRLYSADRGEILRPAEDRLQRKRSARTLSLIKNESWGIEDDQIPS